MTPTFAIVGANLAGGRAAEALRAAGFDGRILLIGAEPHPPYERPPLSKELLKGTMEPEGTFLRPAPSYADDDIELILGTRVLRVIPSERMLELEHGEYRHVDKVLLCTGGAPRRLEVPGVELGGVTYVRTLEDAQAVRAQLQAGARVVVVGAGFIGAEVAACARDAGCDVTMLEVAPVPLSRVLGAELGEMYARIHRERGVDLRTGVGIESIEGRERVERVIAADGSSIEADLVVVGIGIEPATELAEPAGIRIGNGIVVNEHCETSLENVYAAGDVAYHPNPILGEHLRLEHWQNAQNQSQAAARSMLGDRIPFAEVPWFWSDQYDVNLQMAGHPRSTDAMVVRGDVNALAFCAFYLRDGVVSGAVGINQGRDVRAAKKLIEGRSVVDPARLADPSTDLRTIGA